MQNLRIRIKDGWNKFAGHPQASMNRSGTLATSVEAELARNLEIHLARLNTNPSNCEAFINAYQILGCLIRENKTQVRSGSRSRKEGAEQGVQLRKWRDQLIDAQGHQGTFAMRKAHDFIACVI